MQNDAEQKEGLTTKQLTKKKNVEGSERQSSARRRTTRAA